MAINNPFERLSRLKSLKVVQKVKLIFLFSVLVTLTMILSGCVTFTDYDASQVYTSDIVGTVDPQTAIGQTFVSRRANLNGITIWISIPIDQGNSQTGNESNPITVSLFHASGETIPIFTTNIRAPVAGNNLAVTIGIPNQGGSANQDYYLELTKETGAIAVNGRNEDAYPAGQTYVKGQPIDADIALRLSYDYSLVTFLNDVSQNISLIWLVIPLLILVWLPGWLLIDFSGLRRNLDIGEQSGLSIGISLAIVPLVMLWTTILGIRWTRTGVLFVAGILVAILFVRVIYRFIFKMLKGRTAKVDHPSGQEISTRKALKSTPGASLVLVLIFIVTLAIRLIMVRDLATPAWVDSVHHALITRLILQAGSFPSTYLPYLDLVPTTYHPGFHSIASTFIWLTNLKLEQALLILGQVLNALVIFSVYLFTKTLTHKSSIGLIAAVITGFITPMPAYYTSWGRYTELAGLLILPTAFVLVRLLIDGQPTRQNYWLVILGGFVSGGLFLVHYRVILFLGCLILSYLLVYMPKNRSMSYHPIRVLGWISVVTVAAVVVVSPWLVQTVRNTILPLISMPVTSTVPFFQDFSWAYLTAALGTQSLVLAGLGLLWGMIKRMRFTYLLPIWVALLFLFANLAALHLPGGSLVNNTSVEIMLFLPISLLGGYFVEQIISSWKNIFPKPAAIPFTVLIFLLISWGSYNGARQLTTIINPITVLSRNADLPAIEWIGDNIPENETIVINPFAWGYGLFGGNDGGYWISPLSGRLTLPPPVLYGSTDDWKKINVLSQDLMAVGSDPVALSNFLNSQDLHYVYTGARGGVISPQKLLASGLFITLYHENGVWIFEVKP